MEGLWGWLAAALVALSLPVPQESLERTYLKIKTLVTEPAPSGNDPMDHPVLIQAIKPIDWDTFIEAWDWLHEDDVLLGLEVSK